MAMGKWNVYENDIRIPFFIAGPGVEKGSKIPHIASQVNSFLVRNLVMSNPEVTVVVFVVWTGGHNANTPWVG